MSIIECIYIIIYIIEYIFNNKIYLERCFGLHPHEFIELLFVLNMSSCSCSTLHVSWSNKTCFVSQITLFVGQIF